MWDRFPRRAGTCPAGVPAWSAVMVTQDSTHDLYGPCRADDRRQAASGYPRQAPGPADGERWGRLVLRPLEQEAAHAVHARPRPGPGGQGRSDTPPRRGRGGPGGQLLRADGTAGDGFGRADHDPQAAPGPHQDWDRRGHDRRGAKAGGMGQGSLEPRTGRSIRSTAGLDPQDRGPEEVQWRVGTGRPGTLGGTGL